MLFASLSSLVSSVLVILASRAMEKLALMLMSVWLLLLLAVLMLPVRTHQDLTLVLVTRAGWVMEKLVLPWIIVRQ